MWVCYIGSAGDATGAAQATIAALNDEAARLSGKSLARRGHRDGNPTSCPGADLYAWVHDGMPTG